MTREELAKTQIVAIAYYFEVDDTGVKVRLQNGRRVATWTPDQGLSRKNLRPLMYAPTYEFAYLPPDAADRCATLWAHRHLLGADQ